MSGPPTFRASGSRSAGSAQTQAEVHGDVLADVDGERVPARLDLAQRVQADGRAGALGRTAAGRVELAGAAEAQAQALAAARIAFATSAGAAAAAALGHLAGDLGTGELAGDPRDLGRRAGLAAGALGPGRAGRAGRAARTRRTLETLRPGRAGRAEHRGAGVALLALRALRAGRAGR